MLRIGRLTIRSLSIIGAMSLCLLFACGDKINPRGEYTTGSGAGGANGALDGGESAEAGLPPGFTYDILPLLKKSCLCHVQGGEPPLLDTYSNVKANANASMQSILDGSMPQGLPPLSTSEKNLFQSWINAGTPNN
jgi:hypothetical protein